MFAQTVEDLKAHQLGEGHCARHGMYVRADKKRKKLQKALRQIDDLKAKKAQGVALEKTQEARVLVLRGRASPGRWAWCDGRCALQRA